MRVAQRETLDLNGWWHVWYDDAAEWRDDAPAWPNTPLHAVRPHTPSAGWDGMEDGMESHQVPGTWEQSRPGYHGVAWYWRPLLIPAHWQGRVVRLRFEAVRLWAEVYVDERLVGYDLDGVTPFEIDLTPHVRPGRAHTLAVRVTNPGGADPGADLRPICWAGLELPASYDVGGIWGAVTLLSTGQLYLQELFVRPRTDLGAALVYCKPGRRGEDQPMALHVRIRDGASQIVAEVHRPDASPDDARWIRVELPIPEPRLWSPSDPHCYNVQVTVSNALGSDSLQATFGMRRFAWEGGHLSLNGERIWPQAARTWGWYPEHGAFPRPAWAEREVQIALELGLNLLWIQDHPPAPALLEASDRQGLLLCRAQSFDPPIAAPARTRALYWRLLRRRLRRLVRRDRNHPSLVWWDLTAGDPSASPGGRKLGRKASRPFAVLAVMVRREDPSRLLTSDSFQRPGIAQNPCDGGSAVPAPLGSVVLADLASPPVLPDLPGIVARHGDRILHGSVAHAHRSWLRQLETEFHRQDLGRTFADVLDLCRATRVPASDELAQAIERSRLGAGYVGHLIDHWAGQGATGLGGLVDLWREPQVDEEALRRAQGPGVLAFTGLSQQLYAGEEAMVTLCALNEAGAYRRALLRTCLSSERSPCLDERTQPVDMTGCPREKLAQVPVCAHGEGRYWLHAELVQDGSILASALRAFWVTRRSRIEPESVHCVDELGLLEPHDGWAWRARSLPASQGSDAALILSHADPRELSVWLEESRSRARRVALFLQQPFERHRDLWLILQRLGALDEPPQPFSLYGPGQLSWALSHRDPLLCGVAPPGVWGPLQAGLRPSHALRGLIGVAQGCALVPSRHVGERAVHLGATLGIVPLAGRQLLISTLPLVEALNARVPIAERLLANVLRWLRELPVEAS
ncbi:MAG: hypothetical protein JXA74_14580 [Anaerolineae bacterium]|nr:hypothetical protein [Anaerolineae bacterium]